MSIRLIVNSDDYGRSTETSRGIREAHSRGIVTSTTAMMNFPTTVADIAIALRETPRLNIGVHLCLTSGYPILPADQVRSLIAADGSFHKVDVMTARRNELNIAEVKAEWTAQIERFIAAAGRKPSHLDSHHHSSYFTPALFQAMLELAQQYGCAIRLPVSREHPESMSGLPGEVHGPILEAVSGLLQRFNPRRPDVFISSFYDESATLPNLLRIIDSLEDGVNELMCHPGYVDPDTLTSSIYNNQRQTELGVLTDPQARAAIQRRGIEMITFDDIG